MNEWMNEWIYYSNILSEGLHFYVIYRNNIINVMFKGRMYNLYILETVHNKLIDS